MPRTSWKRWLTSPAGERVIWEVFRLWVYSLRVEQVGEDPPPPVLYLFWHSKDFVLPRTHRGRGVGVLISLHEDGDLPARLIERMGLVPIRGSSTRGGARAVRTMMQWVQQGNSVGITPDGPRGPRYRVKPGVVKLARMLNVPVVPVGVGYSRFWQARSWDRYEIPWPGSRAVVVFGPPLNPTALNVARVEEALIEVTREAERRARS